MEGNGDIYNTFNNNLNQKIQFYMCLLATMKKSKTKEGNIG